MAAATRWGICSAGKISHDFVLCLKNISNNGQDHQAVAVAARSVGDAKKFADTHGIPKHYGKYEDLASDENIDVIYVSPLHTHHYPIVKKYLEAGKAVLCEKPMTMCAEHTADLVRIARAKNVFLMEAICTPFLLSYEHMLADLKTIGPVQHMIIPFGSTTLGKLERLTNYELGGSLILDCVVYSFNIALDVFMKRPTKLVALGAVNSEGVDVNSSIVMKFDDGALCTMISSASCNVPKVIQIIGTEGSILLDSSKPGPTIVTVNGVMKEAQTTPKIENYNYHPWLGGEIAHVRECLLKKKTESPVMTLQRSIDLAELMEESIKQIGGRVRVLEKETR